MGEIIRINANAMPSYESRCKGKKIPFGGGCLENFPGADLEPVENKSQFVDQGNIDISLSVFDDLCGLGDFY